MYVLTHNDQVFLGPMQWHPRMFQSVINDDYELNITIPATDPNGRYDVNSDIVIRPVEFLPDPIYNPKIQGLNGPFYDVQADKLIGHYDVVDLPVDLVKGQLKEQITSARYTKETSGITVDLQNTTVFVSTARGDRDIFAQAFSLGATNVMWKFVAASIPSNVANTPPTQIPEQWLTVTNTELGQIVQAIMAHVHDTFAWENTKHTEIDSCTTLSELDAVVLV